MIANKITNAIYHGLKEGLDFDSDETYLNIEKKKLNIDAIKWNKAKDELELYLKKRSVAYYKIKNICDNYNVKYPISDPAYLRKFINWCCKTPKDPDGVVYRDFNFLDVSKITDMSFLFKGCIKLYSLDISSWDMSNVTNMRGMFSNCLSLKILKTDNWKTSNVTDLAYMFYHCISLTELDLNHWDMSNAEDLSSMFNKCDRITTLNIDQWNMQNAKNISLMFDRCKMLKNLNIKNWKLPKDCIAAGTFIDCPPSIIPKWYGKMKNGIGL